MDKIDYSKQGSYKTNYNNYKVKEKNQQLCIENGNIEEFTEGLMPKIKFTNNNGEIYFIKIPNTFFATKVSDGYKFVNIDGYNGENSQIKINEYSKYCCDKISEGAKFMREYGLNTPEFYSQKIGIQVLHKMMHNAKTKQYILTHIENGEIKDGLYALASKEVKNIHFLRNSESKKPNYSMKVNKNDSECIPQCPNEYIEKEFMSLKDSLAGDDHKIEYKYGFPGYIQIKEDDRFEKIEDLPKMAAVSILFNGYDIVSNYDNVCFTKTISTYFEGSQIRAFALDIDDICIDKNHENFQFQKTIHKNYIDISRRTAIQMVKNSSEEFKNEFYDSLSRMMMDKEINDYIVKSIGSDYAKTHKETLLNHFPKVNEMILQKNQQDKKNISFEL